MGNSRIDKTPRPPAAEPVTATPSEPSPVPAVTQATPRGNEPPLPPPSRRKRRGSSPTPTEPRPAAASRELADPVRAARERLERSLAGSPAEVQRALADWGAALDARVPARELSRSLTGLSDALIRHDLLRGEVRDAWSEAVRASVDSVARQSGLRIDTSSLTNGAVFVTERPARIDRAQTATLAELDSTLFELARRLHRVGNPHDRSAVAADEVFARLQQRRTVTPLPTPTARERTALRDAHARIVAAMHHDIALPTQELDRLTERVRSVSTQDITSALQQFSRVADQLIDRARGELATRAPVPAASSLLDAADRVVERIPQLDVAGARERVIERLEDRSLVVSTHITEASLVGRVADALGGSLTVRDMHLRLATGRNGALTGLGLEVGSLGLRADAVSVGVTNPEGQRLRFNVRADEDRIIREVALELPDPTSSLVVATDDARVRLGQQSTRFTFDPSTNIVRLVGQGTNVDAHWRDGSVHLHSARADVALDGNRLVLNDVRGTRLVVRDGNNEYDFDIPHIEKQLVSLGRFDGPVKGFSVVLSPTGDGSTVNATVHARAGSTPFSLSVRDARSLSVGGYIAPNQVRYWAVDPAGQGQIVTNIGPLEMRSENGGIRMLAQYHEFDGGRLVRAMSGVFQAVHRDGIALDENALILRASIPAPREPGSWRPHLAATASLPHDGYGGIGVGPRTQNGAPGVLLETGVSYVDDDRVLYRGALYGGVMPGSYGHFEMQQGTAKIAGLPVRELAVPTTVVAGATMTRRSGQSALTIGAGVHDNLVSRANNEHLRESARPGAHVQAAYCEGQLCLSGTVAVTPRAGGPTDKAAMVRLGWRF